MVFAMSHPKLRQAMADKLPCLGIQEDGDHQKSTTHDNVEIALELK